MKPLSIATGFLLAITLLLNGGRIAHGEEPNGLAPEITDLNAADISYQLVMEAMLWLDY